MSGIVDRERYGTLAGIIAETLLGTEGVKADPATVPLITEQIVRTIEADPTLGQSGAVIRISQSLEGIASSLHVLQGLYAMDCQARGVVQVEHIKDLVDQAIKAYNLSNPQEPIRKPGQGSPTSRDPSDLPPGVLG